jgi:hypothetical protein
MLSFVMLGAMWVNPSFYVPHYITRSDGKLAWDEHYRPDVCGAYTLFLLYNRYQHSEPYCFCICLWLGSIDAYHHLES